VYSYCRSLTVEDASGARFQVHEYRRWRFIAWICRFQLDTGEPARRVDEKTFEVIATGEKLLVCPCVTNDAEAGDGLGPA
jgi:hypothetical protein